jgi:hypothetical protein
VKPGDLVRLKAGFPTATGVAVSWTPPGGGALDVKRFDTGTPALLLQTDEVEFLIRKERRSVSFILIEGRMGWVWPQELEPL